ncbi:Uncharacterised protein [uncultured Eubacterium sp.]|nr:Uncharacterised protein [uncultured Eubacterium sp.]
MESLGLSHLDMVKYAENIGMNRHFKDLVVYRVSVFSVCFSRDYHILRRIPMDAWIEIFPGTDSETGGGSRILMDAWIEIRRIYTR